MRSQGTLVSVLLAALSVALIASSARAASNIPNSVPNPYNDTVPRCIPLVGNNGAGLVDGAGNFTIIIRDINNVPVNNSLVVVDLSGCTGGLWICAAQNPGLTVSNTFKAVYGFTNGVGMITMAIGGHGTNVGDTPPYPAEGCVKIYADGMLVGSVDLRVYDHDGSGLSGGDLSAWLSDFFGSQPLRSDYDCDGRVSGADLAQWLSVFFMIAPNSTGSSSNCPSTGPQYSIP